MMLGRPPMEFDDYLRIVRRRWLWLVVPAVVAPLIAFGVSLKLPESYVSQTLVLIEQQKVPEGYVKPVVTEDLNGRLASMREQILSRTRLQPLIERFGLYEKNRVPMEEKLETMRKAIDIKLIRSDVIASRTNGLPGFYIGFTADTPKVAQQVCGEITSLFVSENLKAREQSAAGTTAFLARQLDDAKRSLDEQDARLAEFQRKFVGQLPGQEQTSMNMLATLNTQLEAVTQALGTLEQQKTYNETLLSQQTAAWQTLKDVAHPNSRTPQDDQREVETLEQQLVVMRSKYTEDHPDVIKLKRDLEGLKNKRQAEKAKHEEKIANHEELEPASIQQLRAQARVIEQGIKTKRIDQQRLQQQISVYQHRLESSPTIQEEHKKLTRDYQTALQFYNELLAKKNQSEMATDLERRQQGEQFRVVDPPNLPERPTFPNRPLFAAGGVGAGLMLGLALIVSFEFLDKSVRTERDIELWLNTPVLGILPEFISAGDTPEVRKERKLAEKQRKQAVKKEKLAQKHRDKPTTVRKPAAAGLAAVTAGAERNAGAAAKSGVEAHV